MKSIVLYKEFSRSFPTCW